MRSSLETPYELKVRYHALWLMSAIAYPAWAVVAEWTDPNVSSQWRQFLWASPIFLIALLFSKLTNPRMRTMRAMHAGLTFSLTLHYFLLLKFNGLSISTVIGCFILVFSAASTFATRRALLCYSAFAVALSMTLVTLKGPIPPSIVICGLLMALAISFVGVWDRLNAIDRLREIQRKLEAANRQTEGILSSVHEGFATFDKDLRYTYLNPAGIEALGPFAEDLVGKLLSEVHPSFHNSALKKAIDKVLTDRVAVEFEDFYDHNPESTWWETRLYPAENGGVSMFFRNVTENRRIQKVLKEQEAKSLMSAKMSTLGEMASGIAHEINNPLAIIYARAELLQSSVRSGRVNGEMVVSASEKICETVMRISRIVKGLRAFARDGGQDPFESVTARNLIRETLELCNQRFVVNNVELRIADVRPILSLECRPTQVSQILLNLLNNAFDAVCSVEANSHDGGSRVSADYADTGRWVELSCSDSDDDIEIRVSNSGPPIEPWVKAKLFQPFFTTKDPNRGTGLGLSIARGIAESHGGRLDLDESTKDTCFVLTLPKRQARTRAA